MDICNFSLFINGICITIEKHSIIQHRHQPELFGSALHSDHFLYKCKLWQSSDVCGVLYILLITVDDLLIGYKYKLWLCTISLYENDINNRVKYKCSSYSANDKLVKINNSGHYICIPLQSILYYHMNDDYINEEAVYKLNVSLSVVRFLAIGGGIRISIHQLKVM